jgi:hypothetical protein
LLVPFDFFIQAQYRDVGKIALWTYPAEGLLGGLPPIVQFFAVFGGDALMVAIPMLWISRVIANIWKSLTAEAKAKIPTESQREALFARWSEKVGAFAKRDASFYILRGVGLAYFVYLGIALIGAMGSTPYPEPLRNIVKMTYENAAISINTYMKIVLMAMLAMIGAYNKELRFHTSAVLLVGHAVSIIASFAFYLADPVGTPYRDFLLTSAIFDTLLAIGFIYVMIVNRTEKKRYEVQKDFPEFYSIGNRLTVNFFYGFGIFSAAICGVVIAIRLFADPSQGWGALYGFPDPQICNTLTKFSALCSCRSW